MIAAVFRTPPGAKKFTPNSQRNVNLRVITVLNQYRDDRTAMLAATFYGNLVVRFPL